ncbi:DUF1810 domain-containing protein [Pedobacter frigidisoli]|uniref:DUF1810 domain-containing protein n=1 Tax=Pedobacter frigidisoli TaxID=2530455 RepID=UPI00292F7046|nr:DUF1810 domain-containing protein [Pedobacter frigidisoli]
MAERTLERFISAQATDYEQALSEIKGGRKRSHWMWYIFPQMSGLGFSDTSKFYAINNLTEAKEYMSHPVLGKRLIEISQVLLDLDEIDALKIFGSPDDMKLKSCMTLFSSLPQTLPVFQAVLNKFFNGQKDPQTIKLIQND